MYDKITFRIYRSIVGDTAFDGLRFFCKEGRNDGFMGNIYIKFEDNKIDRSLPSQEVFISGSIRKWITSSNVIAPTFEEAAHEIEEICKTLGVKPQDTHVTGLEFGSTYEMRKPPHRYMSLINSCSGTKRGDISIIKGVETVSFKSVAKQPGFELAFYDKGAEVLAKTKTKLDYYALRFEVKIFKGLGVKVGWKESITLATLQDPRFFNKVKDYYLKKYNMIHKLKELQGDCKVKTGLQGAYIFFGRLGAEYLRDHPNGIDEYLKMVKEENPEIPTQEYKRIKRYIKRILESFETENDPNNEGLIEELNRLINTECERCSPKSQ